MQRLEEERSEGSDCGGKRDSEPGRGGRVVERRVESGYGGIHG